MKKYFTSIDSSNNQYVGTVFDSSTNQEVYKTRAYQNQTQAIQDVNTFLAGNNNNTASVPAQPQTIVNTTTYSASIPKRTGRCCGR